MLSITLLLFAGLTPLAPGSAAWRSSIHEANGEPSTGLPDAGRGDFDPEAMWQVPNDGRHEPVADRIYLDAVVDTFVHPHTPAPKPAETSPRNYVLWYMHAFLGTWR
ncbi:MAG: hypothetical protein R3185_01525, partial [Candidatus Thermoplasmatota archaeon]|nr:hypothetical protein [Candidatus Thermoplasmatota archaeon]